MQTKTINIPSLNRKIEFFYMVNETIAFNALVILNLITPIASLLESDYEQWTFKVKNLDIKCMNAE